MWSSDSSIGATSALCLGLATMRRNVQRWQRNIGGNIGQSGASPNIDEIGGDRHRCPLHVVDPCDRVSGMVLEESVVVDGTGWWWWLMMVVVLVREQGAWNWVRATMWQRYERLQAIDIYVQISLHGSVVHAVVLIIECCEFNPSYWHFLFLLNIKANTYY